VTAPPGAGLRIFDADAHVMEPEGMWERYIDARFKSQAPRVVRDAGRTWLATGERRSPRPDYFTLAMRSAMTARRSAAIADAHASRYDAASQVRAMDEAGIEVAVLYPSQGLYAAAVADLPGDLALAICRAYNEWIVEFCAYAPRRLRPAAMLVGLHDPEAAAREAERLGRQGFRALLVRPNPIGGRTLGHPAYEPLWTACERAAIAVGVHEGAGSHLDTAGSERFRGFFAVHTASHPVEQMLALLALVAGGVFERHPALRVAFLEAGCGWVPYWLWRMDDHWEKTRGVEGEPELPLRPSAYFRRQCWVTCEGDEPDLARVAAHLGEDRLIFGSDYPHPDHAWPGTVDDIRRAPLDERAKRRILWDNPVELYGPGGQ
jgi:predicted TIM-barrel fold metal-dependent hydrolase